MKKKEKFAIVLLGALMVFSVASTNVSAASSSYVGVKVGDQFIWRASLNMANINATAVALVGQENWTLAYNMLMEMYENETGMPFSNLAGAGIKMVIQNVTEEMSLAPGVNATGLYFDFYTSSGDNNWTLQSDYTNYTSPMMVLVDPTAFNKTTIIEGLLYSGYPFIIPVGYNFTMLTQEWQKLIDSSPYTAGNFTVATQGNGFKVTMLGTYLDYMYNASGDVPFNITGFGDVVATAKWNNNGVFERGTVSYNGLTLVTAYLETNPTTSIPGYELPILAIAGGSAIIAMVYVYKKKIKF
jgi:hypothetical protein